VRVILGAIVAACTVAGSAAAGTGPPQIREPFTAMPCPMHPQSTLDLEGCSEQAVLKSDAQINGRVRKIYALLSGSGRTAFATGERAWLAYRGASCKAEASPNAGGSIQPVTYANCLVSRNKTHIADLAALQTALRTP
jgi:uncharacterized protein YecT (DUF1311 family)